jgi:hypothetical protein
MIPDGLIQDFRKVLSGEMSLGRAFWIYYVCAHILTYLALAFISLPLREFTNIPFVNVIQIIITEATSLVLTFGAGYAVLSNIYKRRKFDLWNIATGLFVIIPMLAVVILTGMQLLS